MTNKNRLNIVIGIVALAFGAALIWSQAKNPEPVEQAETPSQSTNTPPASNEPDPQENTEAVSRVVLEVPFTTQAPTGNWDDGRQQDGCEEASLLMAWSWVIGAKTITPSEAEKTIIDMSEFEKAEYGNYLDLNAQDSVKLMKDYFKHQKVSYELDITIEDIKDALRQGKLVIVPANGKRLNNPNFSNGGPNTHMFVIKGFDDDKRQFITNDPGTRNGRDYVYSYNTVASAMVNYPSGYHEDQTGQPTAMIVIEK